MEPGQGRRGTEEGKGGPWSTPAWRRGGARHRYRAETGREGSLRWNRLCRFNSGCMQGCLWWLPFSQGGTLKGCLGRGSDAYWENMVRGRESVV